ncbi:MAG TPA: thiamine-phosphate kinase [Steroidobacteraceae bacterium]|nr:thiamine-phosphate kinase [Steroidobacteraceae bacterium]
MSEFELIARHFARLGAERGDVRVGVGDDGAVVMPPAARELVMVVDTLVESVHFPRGSPAASIGHRAFAVNLSDIAAMGAEPAWALLALTLPDSDEEWLTQFARAAGDLCRRHGVSLIGGDTTRGPLSITVTLVGIVPIGVALERKGAQAGDAIFVTGSPGDAAAGLALEQDRLHVVDPMSAQILRDRFLFPTPRCEVGIALRGLASACIDVSDGLGGDLEKLCAASGCGAEIDAAALPVSEALVAAVGRELAREYALTGGDDYELLFCVPASRLGAMTQAMAMGLGPVTRIGRLVSGNGVRVSARGGVTQFSGSGFDHFARHS